MSSPLDDTAAVVDGTRLYYTHPNGVGGDNEIYEADRSGDISYTDVRSATSLNSPRNENPITTSRDGMTFYLASDRDGANHLYAATRAALGDEFGTPVPVFDALGDIFVFTLSDDELTMYASTFNDLFLSQRLTTSSEFTALQPIDSLTTAESEYDLNVGPDNRAFFVRTAGAGAASFWTADFDPVAQTFTNARTWELSQPGVDERSLRLTRDGTELWLGIVGALRTDLYVSRRACLN